MDLALLVFGLFNLAIFAGYFFVALFIAPELDIPSRRTRLSGVVFFATCGLTHIDLAYHAFMEEALRVSDFTSPFHLAVHGAQAISVWFFVTGIYRDLMAGRLTWPLPIRQRSE
jgi:hypothetical protein